MASDPKRPITVTEMVTVKQERRDIEYSWTDLLDTFDYSSIVSQLMIRVEEVATERDAAIARAERLAAEVIAWRRAAAIFDGSGNPLGIHFFQHTHGARVAVDAHRDLEGKEHVGGVCWMIERGQRHGEVEPLYWTGADWSKDPCKGMRFANSRAATDYAVAEVLLSGIEGVHPRKWEVTEHVFMDAHRDLEGGAA